MNIKSNISAIIHAIGSNVSTKVAMTVKYRNSSLTEKIFLPTYGLFLRTQSRSVELLPLPKNCHIFFLINNVQHLYITSNIDRMGGLH